MIATKRTPYRLLCLLSTSADVNFSESCRFKINSIRFLNKTERSKILLQSLELKNVFARDHLRWKAKGKLTTCAKASIIDESRFSE